MGAGSQAMTEGHKGGLAETLLAHCLKLWQAPGRANLKASGQQARLNGVSLHVVLYTCSL